MSILKRIFFFSLVNVLVIFAMLIVWSAVSYYFQVDMSSYLGLLVFCSVFGMVGSFISLFVSKFMAKKLYKIQIISPNNMGSTGEKELLNTIYNLSRKAGLKVMPEVGIYPSPEVNAFATGPSRNNSLVAVSAGLLQNMNSDEVEGVLAHEVSHIANGDMVTMTLIQGVVNSLVLFLAQIVSRIVSGGENDSRSYALRTLTYYALYFAFSFLGSLAVNYFSRWREFRADAGSARIAGREKMIAALKKLQSGRSPIDSTQPAIAALKISSGPGRFLGTLFSTHPSLEDRIARLQSGQY